MLAITVIVFVLVVLALFAKSWHFGGRGPGIMTKVKIFLTHFQVGWLALVLHCSSSQAVVVFGNSCSFVWSMAVKIFLTHFQVGWLACQVSCIVPCVVQSQWSGLVGAARQNHDQE